MNTTVLEQKIATALLGNVSSGLAVFCAKDFVMCWRNSSFRKQTWFGGASGGKAATRVVLWDLFAEADHAAISELFTIACDMGQSYDFQRMVRRGPVGSFPAELRFHKLGIDEGGCTLICLEISDLSLNKLYDELQSSHAQMRERLADLMAAQAELQYSVRMNTISEFGADLAHFLINPVTMCRDIIISNIAPLLENSQAKIDLDSVFRYLKDIENFAVWFRKFSDPHISETQICRVISVVEDSLSLNLHRFSKQGISTKIRINHNLDPFVLSVPVDLIMWLNAAFSEISSSILPQNPLIYIDISEEEETVSLNVHSLTLPGAKEKVSTETLDKLARRLRGSVKFSSNITEEHVSFSLSMAAFREVDAEESIRNKSEVSLRTTTAVQENNSEKSIVVKSVANPAETESETPLVLLVDDERDIRKLLKRALKHLQIESIEAEDGVDALDLFEKAEHSQVAKRIKAIVSDIRMPRMTGPHLLVALRQANVQLPFIFFSSNLVDQGQQGGGFKYENVHYLTKESGLEELKTILLDLMKTP